MAASVALFLEKVGKLKRTQEKINALKSNDSYVLRVVLQAIYDPNVKFALPEGTPPYKPNSLVDQEYVLIADARYISYFIESLSPDIKPMKRESLFVEFLERLDPKDAELVLQMKDKKVIKGITIQHVVEALPGIIAGVEPNLHLEEQNV
jgi:hypothetical protein